MPRVLSSSLDDTAHSADTYIARRPQHAPLNHAASAIELRRSRRIGYDTLTSRNRKGLQQPLRTVSSLPLRDISHNSRSSVSRSVSSCGKEPFPSLHASECDESIVQTPERRRRDFPQVYLTPPNSETNEPAQRSPENYSSESSDGFPFPLNPAPLSTRSPARATNNEGPRTPRRRLPSPRPKYLTPSPSPDRYISSRFSSQEPSKTFRLSKSPHQLSRSEKLLRYNSASPDPFSPLIVPRLRNTETAAPANGDPQARHPPSSLAATANVLSLPQDALALPTRQPSAGAVWNVGGNSQLTHTGPVRSVSNGRGGFVSSGSNAPMYTTQFFNDDTLNQDLEVLEGRLAAALEIDQTRRILDISRAPVQSRSVSKCAIGAKRKHLYVEPRTRWKDGEWSLDVSRSRGCLPCPSYAIDAFHP